MARYEWNATVDVSDITSQATQIILPAGEYEFEVQYVEKGDFRGSEKMGACPMAKVHLKVFGGDQVNADVSLVHRLYLDSVVLGILCSFFRSVGLREHGNDLKFEWDKLPGRRGRCRVGSRVWKEREYNDIKAFLEPSAAPAPRAQQPNLMPMPKPKFTPGAF